MKTASTAVLIVNEGSGLKTCRDRAERLLPVLADQGVSAELCTVSDGDAIKTAARKAVSSGCSLVIAAGGDGTINAVASETVGTNAVLGVIPFGTFNHFAKDLGIPTASDADAAKVLTNGVVRRVDIGEVNGRLFLNNSSIGLYPRIVRSRTAHQRLGHSKWRALLHASLGALRFSHSLKVRLSVDGRPDETRSAFVFIGNNRYSIEGFDTGSRERLDEGVLSLYLARGSSPWRVAGLAARAAIGRLRLAEDFEETAGREIILHAERATLQVSFDGEVEAMSPPLTYNIRPAALRVMAPVVRPDVASFSRP